MQFSSQILTDAQGVAPLTWSAGSIGSPRKYIDGQVYGVRYRLPQPVPNNGYFNAADFISILVWTDFLAPAERDWNTNVGPILTQYQQLYSVMMQFMYLGDYASVVANKAQMQDVFSRLESDPGCGPRQPRAHLCSFARAAA